MKLTSIRDACIYNLVKSLNEYETNLIQLSNEIKLLFDGNAISPMT